MRVSSVSPSVGKVTAGAPSWQRLQEGHRLCGVLAGLVLGQASFLCFQLGGSSLVVEAAGRTPFPEHMAWWEHPTLILGSGHGCVGLGISRRGKKKYESVISVSIKCAYLLPNLCHLSSLSHFETERVEESLLDILFFFLI